MSLKTNYDSNFCGSLPLHLTNLIQPYGFLVVLERYTLKIIQVSENASELFGENYQSVPGKSIADYLGDADFAKFNEKVASGIRQKVPVNFKFGESRRDVLALIHIRDSVILLEFEFPLEENPRGFAEVYNDINYAMAAIDSSETLAEVCSVAIRELKKLSGFDKIMMYRFDEEWNGTVIAEEMEEGMDPYIGLKFPASDVPKQARALYQQNPYRLIPDRDYKPVGLYPVVNPVTQSFLDLSDCNLRSVAAVHVQYLKNMNVTASMSTRVIRDGQLWGLISCHHREARYLDHTQCAVFELLSSVISSKIDQLIRKDQFEFAQGLHQNHSKLVENVFSESDLVNGLVNGEVKISDFMNAGGAAVVYRGRTELVGETPDLSQVENLVYWLQAKEVGQVYTEASLSELYETAEDYSDVGSGVLVIPINVEKGDFVIAFRPEQEKTIHWGGNPNEAIRFEPDQKNYHPRNSFRLWKETVRRTAVPWNELELEWASRLRSFLFEFDVNN